MDSGKNHVSLTWLKPQSNNSAPVLAYKVDLWLVGGEGGAVWKEVGVTPTNSFDAFNLKQGCEYHFRITPKNRYGWGPSTQTTFPIVFGGAIQLPEFTKILTGQMKSLIDTETTLECVFKGYPMPEIRWYKDGMSLDSSERILIRTVGSICRLTIRNSTLNDSGRYTCEATNKEGRVSTFARLQIVTDPKIYAADDKLKKYIATDTVRSTRVSDPQRCFILISISGASRRNVAPIHNALERPSRSSILPSEVNVPSGGSSLPRHHLVQGWSGNNGERPLFAVE